MHKIDIERTRRQVERVADKAQEIVELVETVSDAGYDVSGNKKVTQKQSELVDELAQALSDFNELTNRAETVELNDISYSPSYSDVSLTHDSDNKEVTIEYTGSKTISLSDVTVLKAGSEITPFSSELTNGSSVSIDVSGLSDGDSVSITLPQERTISNEKNLSFWNDLIGSSQSPEIQIGDMTLPEHNLVDSTSELTQSITIGNIV